MRNSYYKSIIISAIFSVVSVFQSGKRLDNVIKQAGTDLDSYWEELSEDKLHKNVAATKVAGSTAEKTDPILVDADPGKNTNSEQLEADKLHKDVAATKVDGSTAETTDKILVDADRGKETHLEKLGEFEFYTTIHNSDFPAEKAGEWIYRPEVHANSPSKEHLHCLDQERQGNCHDPDSWTKTNDTAKLVRHKSMTDNAIVNSPGILSGDDPWMWQSKLPQYRVLLFKDRDFYAKQVGKALRNRTIYLVGDSLTRQWSQSMRCELIHVLGMSPEEANEKVRYVQVHNGIEDIRPRTFDQTTERDVVVFNIGHHVGFKIGENWTTLYREKLEKVLTFPFGKIPYSNKFFRTTSVRHYIRGAGDWDTESSQAGSVEPSMREKWSRFGGSRPEQPTQNLIAFEVFLQNNSTSLFQILDTSPMMLARADSTFDGCHFCLPGPQEYWSRMLYQRLYYY